VKRENPASLEKLARPVFREHPAFPASPDSRAYLACQEIRDLPDDSETQDHQDLTARTVSMARQGCPAHLETEASLVRMEPPAFRDCPDHQAPKATLDRLAFPGTRGRLANRGTLDCLDQRVHEDIGDRQDRRVTEGHPDRSDLRVHKD